MKKFLVFTLFLCLCFYSGYPQSAGWIETDVSESIVGNSLVNCGDNLIIYTKSNADIVYFFDTNSNEWQSVSFGSLQIFKMAMADECTAFAYSDEYLVGYSSILSQWDTVKYKGSVLAETFGSDTKGYGCSGKFAYFVTSANMFYVFDAELAQWRIYNYGIVLNTSGINRIWAADTFVGAIFERNDTDFAKNIAYSLHTHSFAELDQGGWYHYPDSKMTGGFVSAWSNFLTESKYFGYSSVTNEFKDISIPMAINIVALGASVESSKFNLLDEINTLTTGYVIGDTYHRDLHVNNFSTQSGKWYSYEINYDPREIIGGFVWRCGGRFSLGSYIDDNDDMTVGLWKFYGETGNYVGENPDLFKSRLFIAGGKVAFGVGDHNLWFHSFENQQTTHKYFPPDDDIFYAQHFAAENYCSVFRANSTSDTMKVFFYNGRTNRLHTVDAYKKTSGSEIATARVYAHSIGGPDNEVLFYSEEKDTLIKYQAPETYGGNTVRNNLALHTTQNYTTLFDAGSARIYEKNFKLSYTGALGDSIFFTHTGDSEVTLYNAIKKEWRVKELDQPIYGDYTGDVIGLCYGFSYDKYWGYSAYTDSFYELEPEGNFVSPYNIVGGKTALVIRSSKIYAFSPGVFTPSTEHTKDNSKELIRIQNSPNPFFAKTQISYQISRPGLVSIAVYDISGKKLETIYNGKQKTGKYYLDFQNTRLTEGIYLLHMTVDNRLTVTQKMMLKKNY